MVDVSACGSDAPADMAGITVTGGSGTVTYSCVGMGCSIGGPTKKVGQMANFAVAWAQLASFLKLRDGVLPVTQLYMKIVTLIAIYRNIMIQPEPPPDPVAP